MSTSIDNDNTQVTTLPPPEAAAFPAAIGDLQLGERLAVGFSGETYAAKNALVGRQCVIKLLHRGLGTSPAALGRLSHQARQADLLHLEGVVPYFGSGTGPDGRRFTIHGWATGHSLREILAERGALSRRVYGPIIDRLCRTLGPLHAVGMVHGALHAGNVMVEFSQERPPAVRLLDVGVKALHQPVGEAAPAGIQRPPEMAAFISPEEAKGKEPDPRSDVYALSVLFYQMVTGRLPLLGESYEATLEKQINETPAPPSKFASLPDAIDTLVMHGLEKDPRKRIPSVEALLAGLDPLAATTGRHEALSRVATRDGERFDTSEVVPITPLGSSLQNTVPYRGGSKRRLWMFLGLGTAVVIFMGALVWTLLSAGDPQKTVRKAQNTKARVKHRPKTTPRQQRKPKASPAPAAQPPLAPKGRGLKGRGLKGRGLKGRGLKSRRPTKRQSAPLPGRTRSSIIGRQGARPNKLLMRHLHKLKDTATLRVITTNPQARILLDGKFVGQGKLRTLRRIPAGKHRLELEVDGRRGPPREVELKAGQSLDVTL
ncbi:MAG: serine/threonine protein kinase [Deltaproteobacteria bacterium]|nr:serine/threonine protein kinase [Deltaproteobacteria bacterium]